jgi:hypothetical protein
MYKYAIDYIQSLFMKMEYINKKNPLNLEDFFI